ncbi:MAG: hypothetical protein JWM53_6813 [bacterium]|nr:hypothetical protein [bacterium]
MRRCTLLIALFAAIGGCGAHTTVRGGIYHAAHTSYRLGALGPRWQRHASDADVAFYDPQLDAMIMVNSECPVEHDAPLRVAANTLLIGFTDRETLAEQSVPLAGREALHRRLRAKLDGVPLALDLFVLKKDDCLYDLVYLAPPDAPARGAADFDRLVSGFETVEGERLARRAPEPR